MPWLIAFVVAHAAEITAIGAVGYAVSQIEDVAIHTIQLIDVVKKDKAEKDKGESNEVSIP